MFDIWILTFDILIALLNLGTLKPSNPVFLP